MALLIYREIDICEREIKMSFLPSCLLNLHFIVPSVSIYLRSRGEIERSETGGQCISFAHRAS